MNAPFRTITTPEKARLRVEDFLLLDESGAFADYTKTELIEGEIYVVNAQHSWHARTKTLLAVEFNITLRAMGSDLGRKLRIYAEAGIPEYWVIDLNGG